MMPSGYFPKDFQWGVATSAYQVEGAAHEDGRGPSIWDTFSHTPGKVAEGHTGDVACDHYHRLEEDLDLLAALGVNAYRFSVAWPRILPSGRSPTNPKGLDFYDRLLDALCARGIQPHLTLYHWDLPQRLQDEGGWGHRDTIQHFADYAEVVARRLGDRVASICTLNEPWVVATLGHEKGIFAPGLTDRWLAAQVSHHLLMAHGLAVKAMRALVPRVQLGIVLNLAPSDPARENAADRAKAHLEDGLLVRWYMDPLFRGRYPQDVLEHLGTDGPDVKLEELTLIREPLDFLGINYYTRNFIHAEDPNAKAPGKMGFTDMGWEVYPQGLTDLLLRLARDYSLPPLYITENGAAFVDRLEGDTVHDPERVSYLEQHIAAMSAARDQGVDIRGYFAWSFLDNFEWASGYQKRFGLVYVDFDTQRRVLKDSARWYRDFIASQRSR
ncbi:GH1 family beta-glucosidase [Archangium sp.]|uniref:GH1 family beta-glucosidase n=1 Tax=Archangium sp. TaxID=1872627 RepID=UPI002D74F171|nr:GH1 family beta-glucosidase [Archangium sp.]HYO56953.1 GH1 family beta-glucosidase [Archangium sp.]